MKYVSVSLQRLLEDLIPCALSIYQTPSIVMKTVTGPGSYYPQYWLLIGQCWSRDLNTGLWLVEAHVTLDIFCLVRADAALSLQSDHKILLTNKYRTENIYWITAVTNISSVKYNSTSTSKSSQKLLCKVGCYFLFLQHSLISQYP